MGREYQKGLQNNRMQIVRILKYFRNPKFKDCSTTLKSEGTDA